MDFRRFAIAMAGHFLASLLYVLQKVGLVNAVVDTTSILEHRDELKELWEKRIMADDHSPSPATSPQSESDTTKTIADEVATEHHATVKENGIEPLSPLANGHAKPAAAFTDDEPSSGADAAHQLIDFDDHDDDNRSENDVNSEPLEKLEETTYSTELTASLLVKQADDASPQAEELESPSEASLASPAEEKPDVVSSTARDVFGTTASQIESSPAEEEDVSQKFTAQDEVDLLQEETVTSTSSPDAETAPSGKLGADLGAVETEKVFKSPEVEKVVSNDEDDDGYVRVEECLPPQDDDTADELEHFKEDSSCDKTPTPNAGRISDLVGLSSAATPEPSPPLVQPEMEAFVRSGGVKRILPGVQKTEQPYPACDTEAKIAIEIREMREREEELRVMRESSAGASPQPAAAAASVRSPSPRAIAPVSPSHVGIKPSSVFRASPEFRSPAPPKATTPTRESPVEREIRQQRDREEELRRQQGLPPKGEEEDDSYVKPSLVRSSQVRVFGNGVGSGGCRQSATAKIQMEIEEQTRREMALRECGSIQTISQERTDARVAKMGASPTVANGTLPQSPTNGFHTNGHTDTKQRGTPSPTTDSSRPASIFGKLTAQQRAPPSVRNGGGDTLKRTASVESKIQQEILEMKQREEELRKLHSNGKTNGNGTTEEDLEYEMNQKNKAMDYGNGVMDEDLSPRHNNLIAQWEQRIQKAES